MSDRFAGKTGLVLGVANRRSIAWGIAQQLADGGAQLAFTYQGERIEKNVRELAETVGSPLITSCDVRSDEDLERVFAEVGETFGGKLDLLVTRSPSRTRATSRAASPTRRGPLLLALDVSAYSSWRCGRLAEPLMDAAGGGSILTMTYLGGERACRTTTSWAWPRRPSTHPFAISPGTWPEERPRERRLRRPRADAGRPLHRRLPDDARRSSRSVPAPPPDRRRRRRRRVAFLLSDEAKNVTGTTLYVDSGYHSMGM